MAKKLEYYVSRAYVKWKGHLYIKGDVFPPTFTHHDKARSIYNSRIGVREVEETSQKETPQDTSSSVSKPAPLSGKATKADESAKSAAPKKSTGTVAPKKVISGTTTPGTHK